MRGEFCRGCWSLDGGTERSEKMGDHRVILFEGSQHGSKVGVGSLDRRKKPAVLAAVVPIERHAKSAAVDQQITRRVTRSPVAYSGLCEG